PPPAIGQDRPLQLLVLALAHDPYKGKMGIGKLLSGTLTKRQALVRIKTDGTQIPGKATDLLVFEGLERKEVAQVEAGEIVAVAGFPEIGIGETLADPEQPIPVPPVAIDEPTVQMTFSVNTSPFAGREGKYVTSRHLRERLYKGLETNVALRAEETASTDQFLVAGRGELHLAVLIEAMRREGYELQVSQPEVILREADGMTPEPYGALIAYETGTSSAYGLNIAQERGALFIGPGVEVYEGMVVGENARGEDLDVNVCKAKHLTNMRASGSDEAIVLTPPREMTLEFALEYIGPDEVVEVTPASIRIRKRLLEPEERRKARKTR